MDDRKWSIDLVCDANSAKTLHRGNAVTIDIDPDVDGIKSLYAVVLSRYKLRNGSVRIKFEGQPPATEPGA